jgi:hypothetical protein
MRLPNPKRAEVEAILKREHIREDDAVTLKRFGERTISNPFRLRQLDFFRNYSERNNLRVRQQQIVQLRTAATRVDRLA